MDDARKMSTWLACAALAHAHALVPQSRQTDAGPPDSTACAVVVIQDVDVNKDVLLEPFMFMHTK